MEWVNVGLEEVLLGWRMLEAIASGLEAIPSVSLEVIATRSRRV